MRWPFGPPHLTLKPWKKNKKNKKKQKTKKRKRSKKKQRTKKQRNYKNSKKELFSYQSIFSFFLVGVQNFPFWQLGPKSAHPKNTIKIAVSATHFVENSPESRNGHFWTKKSQIQKFQLSFFLLFLLLQQQKTQTLAETPIFIVFWQTPQKIIFKI